VATDSRWEGEEVPIPVLPESIVNPDPDGVIVTFWLEPPAVIDTAPSPVTAVPEKVREARTDLIPNPRTKKDKTRTSITLALPAIESSLVGRCISLNFEDSRPYIKKYSICRFAPPCGKHNKRQGYPKLYAATITAFLERGGLLKTLRIGEIGSEFAISSY